MLQETERIVGLTEEIVRSDELLGAYVRDNVGTYCHALGTLEWGLTETQALLSTNTAAFAVSRTCGWSMPQ